MSTIENMKHLSSFDDTPNHLNKSGANRKRYDCNQCSKYFSRPSALQTHIYTHTGEKPHKCDIPGCGRRFAVISNLRRHLRVHRPSNLRRRLTSFERRAYIEQLIQKSGGFIDETQSLYLSNNSSSLCYSFYPASPSSPTPSCTSASTTTITHTADYGYNSPVSVETSGYRLLKPKQTRPLCLTVKHLL
ncbi:hypothetical protein BDF20DRAFT_899845, partial [Mycotypha africana]|uniref:uncharacterized protein n=1 Tax=Mycotypha africana TaxID=64632 RepID=UPI002300AD8F